MTRLTLLAAASLCVLISACGPARLPAQDAASGEAAGPALTDASAIPEGYDEYGAEAEEEDDDEYGDYIGEGVTPTVDRDAGPTETAAEGETVEAAALAPEQPSILELYNAQQCLRPSGTAPTPTVSAAAGATQTEEPVVGAEAVNAVTASLGTFPGIVKIEPRRTETSGLITSGHCSAVRIRENWLLTAAHCVDQPYDELRVIADAANLRNPAARVTAADAAICHGGYLGTDNGYANDIALLRLSPEQATAMPGVPVARLGATALPLAPANYPTGDMAGWGLTRFGGQLSNDLLSTRVKITSVGPSAITVSSNGGAGPCIGDSGGPLYVTEADGTRTAVGVLSVVEQNRATGQFCAGDYNGRYTNLQGYAAWIDNLIAVCDTDADACR